MRIARILTLNSDPKTSKFIIFWRCGRPSLFIILGCFVLCLLSKLNLRCLVYLIDNFFPALLFQLFEDQVDQQWPITLQADLLIDLPHHLPRLCLNLIQDLQFLGKFSDIFNIRRFTIPGT